MNSGMRGMWTAFLLIMTVILCGQVPNAMGAAQLPTIVPAQLPAAQVDRKAWTGPVKVDGREVRIVKAGREAVLKVKPWWADRLRPAEGQYWMVVVQYKDTSSQPVIFKVFGNLGKGYSRTELHRFGGLNDGKWKRAEIPLPWDMIMARPDTGMVEMSLGSQAGDVPVASIKIDKLNKKDLAKAAEQYNRETREWIARVQSAKYSEPRKEFGPAQTPAKDLLVSSATIIPYVRSYLQPIFPYSAPQTGEVGEPLEATMSLGEYEPATLGIYAHGKELTNVQVRVEDLKHEKDGKATLEASVRTAEYALVQNGRVGGGRHRRGGAASAPASQPRTAYAVFPQRLWPMYPVAIKKGQSQWVWVTLHSDAKTTAPGCTRARSLSRRTRARRCCR